MAQPARSRPTLRCLEEDLKLTPGTADEPLDKLCHPLLTKVNDQFADTSIPRERIVAIDDQILFKAKVQRYRGAVWIDVDPAAAIAVWTVAAGVREDGSPEDFYAALHGQGQAARKRYNATHSPALTTDTHTAHLLPGKADHSRLSAESAARFERQLAESVRTLCRATLLNGREHGATVAGVAIGIQIRADDGHDAYVGIRIVGSVPDELSVAILDLVPGCDSDGCFPEYSIPERPLAPAEQAWSNVIDPGAAAKLLDDE
jgi:hypothetical protein